MHDDRFRQRAPAAPAATRTPVSRMRRCRPATSRNEDAAWSRRDSCTPSLNWRRRTSRRLSKRWTAALHTAGGTRLAVLVSEGAANNFPRLPVREGEHVLAWFAALPDEAARARLHEALAGSPAWIRAEATLTAGAPRGAGGAAACADRAFAVAGGRNRALKRTIRAGDRTPLDVLRHGLRRHPAAGTGHGVRAGELAGRRTPRGVRRDRGHRRRRRMSRRDGCARHRRGASAGSRGIQRRAAGRGGLYRLDRNLAAEEWRRIGRAVARPRALARRDIPPGHGHEPAESQGLPVHAGGPAAIPEAGVRRHRQASGDAVADHRRYPGRDLRRHGRWPATACAPGSPSARRRIPGWHAASVYCCLRPRLIRPCRDGVQSDRAAAHDSGTFSTTDLADRSAGP